MKTKTIRQRVTLPASPYEVYALLLDSRRLTRIHGSKASFSKRSNGPFSVFDGYCHGYNLRLEPGRYIEQAWHFREAGWPDDHYTVCRFMLTASGQATKLSFVQTGVPEHKYVDIREGWKAYYWLPLRQYLRKL